MAAVVSPPPFEAISRHAGDFCYQFLRDFQIAAIQVVPLLRHDLLETLHVPGPADLDLLSQPVIDHQLQLIGETQAVIKPLSGMFNDVRGVSGTTIMGDGRISLILDVGPLLDLCHA